MPVAWPNPNKNLMNLSLAEFSTIAKSDDCGTCKEGFALCQNALVKGYFAKDWLLFSPGRKKHMCVDTWEPKPSHLTLPIRGELSDHFGKNYTASLQRPFRKVGKR